MVKSCHAMSPKCDIMSDPTTISAGAVAAALEQVGETEFVDRGQVDRRQRVAGGHHGLAVQAPPLHFAEVDFAHQEVGVGADFGVPDHPHAFRGLHHRAQLMEAAGLRIDAHARRGGAQVGQLGLALQREHGRRFADPGPGVGGVGVVIIEAGHQQAFGAAATVDGQFQVRVGDVGLGHLGFAAVGVLLPLFAEEQAGTGRGGLAGGGFRALFLGGSGAGRGLAHQRGDRAHRNQNVQRQYRDDAS